MKCHRLLAVSALLAVGFACTSWAQENKKSAARPEDHLFQSTMRSGATLRLHLRDGDFKIVGTDSDKLTVRAQGKNLEQMLRWKVEETRDGDDVELTLSNVPKNELQVTISVPRNLNLYARMRGGDLAVDGVVGNKDLALVGGDLIVGVGNPDDYAHVDLKVKFGDIS